MVMVITARKNKYTKTRPRKIGAERSATPTVD
jgi:hypothetical protein